MNGGDSPLHGAAQSGHADLVALLLWHGRTARPAGRIPARTGLPEVKANIFVLFVLTVGV
ncbi:MAG: ankyrin repeat domain-containing protein, partial [Bryobacteraceae bacterium]